MDLGNFQFGNPKVNRVNPRCCGKPVGCTVRTDCVYLRHPWKREHVFGEKPSEMRNSTPTDQRD